MSVKEHQVQIDRETFKWWLVYGPPRTGTSYLSRLISRRATYLVSDWGLGHVMNSIDKVHELDKTRFRTDLVANILANARRGGGKYIDMCYKQALLMPEELVQLEKMFGAPQRRIFCIREPAGFVASAVKKFPNFTPANLEERYVQMFDIYDQLGGDILEYGPSLTLKAVTDFIAPMPLPRATEDFTFRGSERRDLVTPVMQQAYEAFRAAHFDDPDASFSLKS